jgi:hypothetical protein
MVEENNQELDTTGEIEIKILPKESKTTGIFEQITAGSINSYNTILEDKEWNEIIERLNNGTTRNI